MEGIKLPSAVAIILERLEMFGYEAYVVGGCVRDSIMGTHPNDWDICTSATPDKVMELFPDKTVIPTGLKHGTVTVVIDEEEFEITTYRTDGDYKDNRHPESVDFVQDLKLDLMRRDFTINSMAYNPKIGIIDYFGGVDDINNKVIRCVGNPDERFSEDVLRIMRAIRFAVRFNFSIEQETHNAMFKYSALLANVSMERINSELRKTLMFAGHPLNSGNLVDLISVLSVVVPELKDCDTNGIVHRITSQYSDWNVGLALLFDFQEEDLLNVLRRLRFSNDVIKSVTTISKYGRYIRDSDYITRLSEKKITYEMYDKADYFEKRLIHDIGWRLALSSIMYAHQFSESVEKERVTGMLWHRVFWCKNSYCLSELRINGNDLSSIGFAGKSIGNTLNALLNMVMRDVVPNDHDKLMQAAESIKEYLV